MAVLRGTLALSWRPHRKMVRPRLPTADLKKVKTDISVAVDAILGGDMDGSAPSGAAGARRRNLPQPYRRIPWT